MLPATEPSNPPPDPERDLEGSFVPLLHGSIICHQVIPDNVWTQLQHKNGWKTPGMGTSFKSQHWRGNRGHPGQSIQSQQGCKSLITQSEVTIPQQEKYMASAFGSEGLVLQVTANGVRRGQVTLCHGWLLHALWVMARFSSHCALAFISKAGWCNSEENLKISKFQWWEAEMFVRVCRWREGAWQMCVVNNPSGSGEMLPPIFFHPFCRVHAQSSDMFWGSEWGVIHFYCCHYLQWMTGYVGHVVNPPLQSDSSRQFLYLSTRALIMITMLA